MGKLRSRTLLGLLVATMAICCLLVASPLAAYADTGNIGPRPNAYNDPVGGIYVSPSGNDAVANGSISAPYKSINRALTAASPGSTIILRGGTYREGVEVRIRMANITIKSAKGEWAIIDMTTYNSGHDWDSGVCFDVESSGGKLQAVEVVGGFYAVSIETTWDWGPYYPLREGASNIIIEDCVLHDSKNDVVKVKPNCNDITIRYCEIYNSGRGYLSNPGFTSGECNAEGIDNVNGDRMHVHNNFIHDICSTGVYAKGGAIDALIEYNRIERAYGAGIMIGFDTSPEFFDTGVNPKYYENISGTVCNNLIIDTGWEGIGLYAAKDAEVHHNTLVNTVTYGTGKYHSPIYFGIATQDWANPSGCPPSINPNIHHNVVVQPSSYTGRMVDIRYISGFYSPVTYPSLLSYDLSALAGMPTMANNCYYLAGGTARFTDMRPTTPLTNAGLAAWKAHISGEGSSFEANPALDTDYMATNPSCSGCGLPFALTVGSSGPVGPPTPPPGVTFAITYSTHVQNIGWQTPVADGAVSGTSGQSLRLEGLRINLTNTTGIAGGIEYATHIQNIGWQTPASVTTNGTSTAEAKGGLSGTSGQSLRLEAMTIKLTGDLPNHYDIYYRVHAQNVGWMGWAKNGEMSGTAGHSLRLEALQIVVVTKGSTAPPVSYKGVTTAEKVPRMIDPGITSSGLSFSSVVHIQSIGDKTYSSANGSTQLGTSGQSLRLEAISLNLRSAPLSGGITYETHIQNIGWQGAKTNGQLSGTSGKGLRLEALRISLTGNMGNEYDVYYRTHVQNIGWTGWAKNGQACGSAGYSYRMEAIQIVIVKQGEVAPGLNTGYFYQK